MSKDLVTQSISELAPLIRNKEISPVELTDAYLQQINTYNDQLNAFILIMENDARASAKQAEQEIMNGHYRGDLHGIPLAIKDNLYIQGHAATAGSKIHRQFVPDYDAGVVTKLKEAGAVFTGKLNLHEYCYGGTSNNPHFGPVRNPWDPTKIPGGSSGGSGAAIAADLTIASLGTDTAGSVRIPASFCGITALKPTFGRVSKYGCFPLSWSLDHVGPMTKTVRDAAIMLETISGYDSNDPTSIDVPSLDYPNHLTGDVEGLVIGIHEEYYFRDVDREVEKLVRQGIQKLEDMGARVEPVKIPSLRYSEYVEIMTMMVEASTIHHQSMQVRPEDFGEDIRLLLQLGEIPAAIDYVQAQQLRRQLSRDFAEAFNKVDVMIGPTLPFIAPDIGQDIVDLNGEDVDFLGHVIRLTGPANVTGLPALSIPCGFKDGLPAGMQIIGPAFKEEVVLNMAYAFEQTNPLEGKKPTLEVGV